MNCEIKQLNASTALNPTVVPGIYGATNVQFTDCSLNLPSSVNTIQLFNAQLAITNSSLITNLIKLDGLTTNSFVNALTLYNARAALSKTNTLDGAPLTLANSALNITNHLKLAHTTPMKFVLGTNAATVNVRSNLFFDGIFNFTAGAGFTNGSFTIFTYSNTLTWGAPSNASAPSGYIYSFDTNTAGQIKLIASLLNTAPSLTAISNRTVIAGTTINFTNTASDTNIPAQTLTFSLQNGPSGTSLNSSNGIFNWRPTIAQSPSTNPMSVIVTDNGSPTMSATQSFTVFVTRPAQPSLQSISLTGGTFQFQITGDAGPDYVIQASTNLANWSSLFTTNSPALPFNWSDPAAGSFEQRYFRVLLGP